MTLRDDLLPDIFEYRAIAGELGMRPHTVSLVVAQSSGTHTGDGARSETVTVIAEAGGMPPKIRWAKDQDVAMGLASKGQVTVGPLTPEFSGGGTELALLKGTELIPGEVRLLRIAGPNTSAAGDDFTIVEIKADRALRYEIIAVPVGTQTV